MNKIIDCICKNLTYGNVWVTSDTIQQDVEFEVIGINNIDKQIPQIITRKGGTKSIFDIPINLIDQVVIKF